MFVQVSNRLSPVVKNNHEIQLFHIQSKSVLFSSDIFFYNWGQSPTFELRTEPYHWAEDKALTLSWGQTPIIELRTEPYHWAEDKPLSLSWGQTPTIELRTDSNRWAEDRALPLSWGQSPTIELRTKPYHWAALVGWWGSGSLWGQAGCRAG